MTRIRLAIAAIAAIVAMPMAFASLSVPAQSQTSYWTSRWRHCSG